MSAKAILHRYLIRRKAELPSDPLELREHLASVAGRDGLKVMDAELDEITGKPENGEPETGDRKPEAAPGAKEGRNSRRKSKRGDNTTKAI